MKNIVVVILGLISILSLAFGYTQKRRADSNELQIKREKALAEEIRASCLEAKKGTESGSLNLDSLLKDLDSGSKQSPK